MNNYLQRLRDYEREKQKLQEMQLTPDQYEAAIQALARRCGV